MIKRISYAIFAVILMLSLLSSCAVIEDTEQIHIVCTVFSQYDWVRNLITDCDNIKLTLLLDSATDMHSYQATADDIVTISSADLFIYTGGDSDSWTEDILENSAENTVKVLNLMESLGEENLCCLEDEEEHVHEDGEEHHHHLYDEHIWMSPEKAVLLCAVIKEAIINLDADLSSIIEKNYEEYNEKLKNLHGSYNEVTQNSEKKMLIVADRFPFLYLVNDYSLDYCAAFVGCSAESEASAEVLINLINETKISDADTVFITETSNGDMARIIKEHIKDREIKISVLNSLQSVKNTEDADYIKIMEDNLQILKSALS